MGEHSIQYISTICVEIGNASTEMLPAHGEEKDTRENHQAQNKNVFLYRKALRMLGYGQKISFLSPPKATGNSLLTDSSV